MKKLIITCIGIGIVLLALHSCKKSSINGDSKDLISGSYLTLTKSINGNLDFSNSSATVSIQVGSKGSPVASVNIYAATGAALDSATWKLIKTVAFTEGMTLAVSTAELSKALSPASIAPGTQYVLQNEVVTKDGRKFSALNTPTNYTSFPAYNFALSWTATAVCAFTQASSIGTYKVVQDDWADYSAGDLITISAGPDAASIQFLAYPSLAYGGTNRQPWIVKVDAASGAATMATQIIGDYPGVANCKGAATGFVFSCTGVISLKVDVTYGGTLYAGNQFTLQKQ
jgi:hypothetical protein